MMKKALKKDKKIEIFWIMCQEDEKSKFLLNHALGLELVLDTNSSQDNEKLKFFEKCARRMKNFGVLSSIVQSSKNFNFSSSQHIIRKNFNFTSSQRIIKKFQLYILLAHYSKKFQFFILIAHYSKKFQFYILLAHY